MVTTTFVPLKSFVSKRRGSLTGFTLIELIITVTIIALLASIVVVKYGPISEKARSAEAYSILAQIVSAENTYQLESSTNSYSGDLSLLDIDLPTSQNFTFTVDTGAGYAKADHTIAGGRATKDYYMCFSGGKTSVNSVPTCP
jgi:prepilin-type N-terminal cleavage/methylation domain-containing protein